MPAGSIILGGSLPGGVVVSAGLVVYDCNVSILNGDSVPPFKQSNTVVISPDLSLIPFSLAYSPFLLCDP